MKGGFIPQDKPIILCVDDEFLNLSLLEMILKSQGYDVRFASNGHEAIDIIKKEKIDLILLDVMMPKMDGYEVCGWIKGNENYREIPVVMVTSLTAREERVKGIEAGAEDFISKPIDQSEVLARIRILILVKNMNKNLRRSYNKLISITTTSESIMNEFNPITFKFEKSIEEIVEQTLLKKGEIEDKPETVMLRIMNNAGGYDWYQYEFNSGTIEKNSVPLDFIFKIPDKLDERTFHFNNIPKEPILAEFKERLERFGHPVRNMVCYLSKDFCLFSMNYKRDVTQYDSAVINNLVTHSFFLKSLSSQIREVSFAFDYTVYALARAAEANDEDTGNHIIRVGDYCEAIAKRLGMSETLQRTIKIQAQMHDVGKIHIPSEVLKKPGKLTPEEWDIMKMHCGYGAKIIGEHERLSMARNISLSHHERWDGGGYPKGLKGEQIPIEGRLINIADQYDALRNKRVYNLHLTIIRLIR